jgi:hypothetical protein
VLDQTFAQIATAFAGQYGAPFIEGVAVWAGVPTMDSGGSIAAPAGNSSYPCQVQFDAPTQAMRQADGFLENDARLLVLSASIERRLDTLAKVTVASGMNAGTWALLSCVGDPAGIGYECRGRRL